MLRLVEEGGAIYSPSPVNSGKVRRARKNIVPIVSVVFKNLRVRGNVLEEGEYP